MQRPEVFLSHASRDRRLVERISAGFDAHGVRYFYSKRHIAGARQWHDELGAALERCNWFVLVLTPSAVKSVWVKRELLFVLQSKRYRDRIAPLLVKDCAMNRLSWTLSSFQHIDFRKSFAEGFEVLVALLRRSASSSSGRSARRKGTSRRSKRGVRTGRDSG